MLSRPHRLTVSEVAPQGSDAIMLTFTVGDDLAPSFGFASGQYLTLAVDVADDTHWRCYSITSPPDAEQRISVLVRRTAGGRVSNWLCDHAGAGLVLSVLAPAGRFTLARPDQPALLFAAGSGIAPIFALAREALGRGAPQVRLFYANRDRRTAMMLQELARLEEASGGRLQITYWYDSEHGLPTPELLGAQAKGFEGADAYLCGPDPFMRAVVSSLQAAQFDSRCIFKEEFDLGTSETSSDEEGDATQLTVSLKGKSHTVDVRPGEMLLAAMLRAGLPAPHACRVGECASCMCKLVKGEVQRLDSSVLDAYDAEQGWLLACRTRSASPEVEVRFI